MKKLFVSSLIVMLFISCEKIIVGNVISAVVSFSFVNSKGEDLLNVNTPGALTVENV